MLGSKNSASSALLRAADAVRFDDTRDMKPALIRAQVAVAARRAQLALDDNVYAPVGAALCERRIELFPRSAFGVQPPRPFSIIGGEGAGFEVPVPRSRITLSACFGRRAGAGRER